ncbi:MAG: TonB family protein [Deltaproteobacteria bacterium]|nr:TonB family protein [Deltaproteobacteria bacterium]
MSAPTPTPAPRTRAESAVFPEDSGRGMVASWVVHGLLFLGLFGLGLGGKLRHDAVVAARTAQVDIEVRHRAQPQRPLPPPPPPPPSAPRVARPASRPAARAHARSAAPPPLLTARGGTGSGGDAVPSGDNTDYRGGDLGGGGASPAPAPEALPDAPEAPVAARPPVQVTEDVEPPVPLGDNRRPEYPAAASRAGVQAVVIARLVIAEDGSVSRVEILRGHPDFDEVVAAALRSWRYRPARSDGRAIAVYQLVRIPFRLENMSST